MEYRERISKEDLAALIGCKLTDIPSFCMARYERCNFNYAHLTPEAREAHIIRVLQRLSDAGIKRDTVANIEAFEKGWQENYDLCKEKGLTRENLRPKYTRPYECFRFKDDYIAPQDPYLLDSLVWIAFNYAFKKYFGECDSVVEYGCGTGQYIYDLAQIFPEKTLVGTDWTRTSGKILGLMAEQGLKVSGRQFDMLKPDLSFKLPPNTGVLTVGALEQIGSNFGAFLEYILSQKPSIVVHLEPIEDFYSNESLAGCLGRLWHRSRNYLFGYVSALKQLEQQGRIQILDSWHFNAGDPFHDSSSRIIWRPS